MKRKSTKKYDMIQAWVNQIDNKWVEFSFEPMLFGRDGKHE